MFFNCVFAFVGHTSTCTALTQITPSTYK